jgi:hypothetical protein
MNVRNWRTYYTDIKIKNFINKKVLFLGTNAYES